MLSERIKEVNKNISQETTLCTRVNMADVHKDKKKIHIHEVAISALCATADTILSKICAECRYTVPK